MFNKGKGKCCLKPTHAVAQSAVVDIMCYYFIEPAEREHGGRALHEKPHAKKRGKPKILQKRRQI